MIHEHGSPSLFLTFSCAEYDSPDIASYLHKVNDVPDGYPIGKLCEMFHNFFEVAIIKGEVLGKVEQFFWKRNTRCVVPLTTMCFYIWINEAPVIGVDSEITVF